MQGTRDRGPSFVESEVKTLLALISQYKTIILNKRTDTSTNRIKEKAWNKITKLFNEQNFKHPRTVDNLKTKWENLKRVGRKLQKSVLDESGIPYMDDTVNQVVELINLVDAISDKFDPESIEFTFSESDNDESKDSKAGVNGDTSNSGSKGDSVKKNRSSNFTQAETSILLKLIRAEKRYLFSKGMGKNSLALKGLAWERITKRFNQLNENKRTTHALRQRFINMRHSEEYVRQLNKIRRQALEESKHDDDEPLVEIKCELPTDNDTDNMDTEGDNLGIAELTENNGRVDPLKFVLNADTGHSNSWNGGENKEVVKLKMELLQYKMETAKLERKRLEDLMESERLERESRAVEMSLRLRTARLEAMAAESKLCNAHPALVYTEQEMLAYEYIKSSSGLNT